MTFSPRYQDDTLPLARFTFQDDDLNIIDISNQNLTLFQLIMNPTPGVDQAGIQRIVGAGTFAYATNGTDGKVVYTWVTADVHVPGNYQVNCVASIGGKPMTSDTINLVIKPKP